jgi:hypothetical protein
MRRSICLVAAIVLAVAITAVVMLFHHRASSGAPTEGARRLEMIPSAPPLTIHPTPPGDVADQYPSQNIHPMPSAGDTNEPTMFALLAEGEIDKLTDGITLAKWMDQRGTPEQWEKDTENTSPYGGGEDPKCADYQRVDELPSKALIIRKAYFYPPSPPLPAVFPSQGSDALIGSCLLGKIEMQAGGVWEMDDKTFLLAVRREFAKQYGENVGMLKIIPSWGRGFDLWGPVFDLDADRWIHKEVEIVSGRDVRSKDPFVRVRLPLVKESEDPLVGEKYDPSRAEAEFHQAVSGTGVDAALSQRMEKLYALEVELGDRLNKETEEMCKVGCPDASKMPKPSGEGWREPLLPLLQDWFKAFAPLGPAQRAAGLLAADRLLGAFGSVRPWGQFGNVGSSTAQQGKLRSALQTLGAKFSPQFASGDYYYASNWLDEASQLDPDSEGGRLALLTWMNQGEGCQVAGALTFRKVISRGEALLSKNIDDATAAQVHFMVGDAYSDIYEIAKGNDQNGSYPDIGENEAGPARNKALEHYRAGLSIDNTSENAKDAWRQAWHLSAGRLPHVRYACFGD